MGTKSSDYAASLLLGDDNTRGVRDLDGDLVIEGGSENSRLVLDFLDLERLDVNGSVIIRNVTIAGHVNFDQSAVSDKFILENVIVDGDLILPKNFWDKVRQLQVDLPNLHVKGRMLFPDGLISH